MHQLGSIQNAGSGRATWTLRHERGGALKIHLEPEGDQRVQSLKGTTIMRPLVWRCPLRYRKATRRTHAA